VSAVRDALFAVRKALQLADDVKWVGDCLQAISQELRDHDRRITRLEAKWEMVVELTNIRSGRPPRQIEG